ncbi:MAG: hypothetical protein Q8P27_00880, partial [Candidatus Peregrinibacteria bacterium]|nr:hypothetical protein [Candidatus Peregrinibacteria bacterium]
MKKATLLIALVVLIGGATALGTYLILDQKTNTDRPLLTENEPSLTDSTETEEPGTVTHNEDAPLYITTMTHMEGNFNDDVVEAVFWKHVEELEYGMDLAEEYGAILTIESEKPFARANVIWEYNIMEEIMNRGHGVGTHCDIGAQETDMSVEEFTELFKENKELVDALVGEENNLGCSGGGSATDWVLAASAAGFKYIDGIVGFHYLAMPLSARPEGWTDAYIRGGAYHNAAPDNIEERIYLILMKDAQDFEHDEDGVIVMSSGEFQRIDSWAEGGRDACSSGGRGEDT